MAEVVTVEELIDYLGVDDEKINEITALRSSAIERIHRATGIDWTTQPNIETFNEAVRTAVWLSYYAVRDAAKNTQYVNAYFTELICALQFPGKSIEPGNEVEKA